MWKEEEGKQGEARRWERRATQLLLVVVLQCTASCREKSLKRGKQAAPWKLSGTFTLLTCHTFCVLQLWGSDNIRTHGRLGKYDMHGGKATQQLLVHGVEPSTARGPLECNALRASSAHYDNLAHRIWQLSVTDSIHNSLRLCGCVH